MAAPAASAVLRDLHRHGGWADDLFMADDPLWTRGFSCRPIACIRVSAGRGVLAVEVLVVLLSLWCVAVPDGYVGLAVVGLLAWEWVAQVPHPTSLASVVMATTIAVLHSALAACTIAPPSARWTRSMHRRWASRTAALIVASVATALAVQGVGHVDIPGNAALLGASLAVAAVGTMWVAGRGHRATSRQR
jgi:hypothetical protein